VQLGKEKTVHLEVFRGMPMTGKSKITNEPVRAAPTSYLFLTGIISCLCRARGAKSTTSAR
jgi:hypothetical protein